MINPIFVAAAFLALAFPAAGQPAASIPPGLYKVDPDHTRVLFALSRFGLTTYRGEFVGASGTLVLNPLEVSASRLDVSVPMTGVTTSSRRLTAELESPAWFDAPRFPTMTFRSTAVAPTGANAANVIGDLTLHGVTRPVTLKVRFTAAGVNPQDLAYTAGFEARGRIKRSEFNIGRYAFLIGDNVDLTISAAFERARS